MGKDKAEKEKKREKKEKRAEKDGVHKSKKDKKEKKEKKDKTLLADAVEKELTTKVLEGIDEAVAAKTVVNGAAEPEAMEVESRPVGALVPFANPLVEDKSAKKVLKSVKKGKPPFFDPLFWLDIGFGGLWLACLAAYMSFQQSSLVFSSYSNLFSLLLHNSCCQQIPQARRKGSRQGSPEIPHSSSERQSNYTKWRRYPRGRHLTHGRDLAHPRSV